MNGRTAQRPFLDAWASVQQQHQGQPEQQGRRVEAQPRLKATNRWSLQEMGLKVTVTPHPATCWTSCCRSRRTPTPGQDQPPLAPWAQGQALDQAQDWDQAATAVVHQLVERLAAEQGAATPANTLAVLTLWNTTLRPKPRREVKEALRVASRRPRSHPKAREIISSNLFSRSLSGC